MSRIAHLKGQKYFGVIGDSKSVANLYDLPLINYLEGRTEQNWAVGFRHATAGWTVANALSGLAAALALAISPLEYILVNIGTNDAKAGLPAENTFKTNYASILDQLHTHSPNAPVLVVQVWRGDDAGAYEANCVTLNGWIDDVIADGRSEWASVAFDETDWLDAWSLDKVHPDTRVGGYSEMARQWFAALSF